VISHHQRIGSGPLAALTSRHWPIVFAPCSSYHWYGDYAI
jgi:hypothetical protein